MNRRWIALLAALALPLAGARADDPSSTPEPKPTTAHAEPGEAVSDDELSLHPGSVFAVPDPAGFEWNDDEPGENALLPRAFPTAPPRVPHAIADFVPITLRANACLDCHALDAGAGAPELPPVHRTDLRRAPETVGGSLAGARWQCLACHVPTTDAKPLRANSAAPR